YQTRLQLTDERLKNATHLVWATGGGMVPEAEMSADLAKSGR
ncbi:D-serine ammonia-lyase, partial [Vibrio parahaemolyticus EKP-028]